MDNIESGNLVQHDDSEIGVAIEPMEPRGFQWGYWRIWWASGHFGGVHFSELKVLNSSNNKTGDYQ